MKDLRPPTCRTHSIVTHTTCSSTHMYTLTNACIIRIHPRHVHESPIIVSASTVFTYVCSTKKRSGEACCFPSSNASLRIRTHAHITYMDPDEKKTHTRIHTPTHTYPVFKTHRVLHFSSSSHPPVSTAMALYSC